MRPITAVAVLAVCLLLGTCSRPQQARYYGAYPPTPLPARDQGVLQPSSSSAEKPPAKTKIYLAKKPAAKTKTVKPKAPPPKVSQTATPDPQVSTTEPRPAPKEMLAAPTPTTVEARFRAAQVKANRDGVQTLTQQDIEGLSYSQIKELRGY